MNTATDPQYPICAPIFVGIIYLMRWFGCAHKIGQSHFAGRKYPSCHSLTPHHPAPESHHRHKLLELRGCDCSKWNKKTRFTAPSRIDAPHPLIRADFFVTVYLGKQIQIRAGVPIPWDCSASSCPEFPMWSDFQYPLATPASNTCKTGKYQT